MGEAAFHRNVAQSCLTRLRAERESYLLCFRRGSADERRSGVIDSTDWIQIILDSISGVKDIHNQLRVQPDQGHQNPFMAQTQMGQVDGQGSNGKSQSRGRSQRNETKAGTSSS